MSSTYNVMKGLGEGGQAVVVQVQSNRSKSVYAAKVVTGFNKEFLVQESNIHSRLIHPNIVQFITSFDIHHCPQNPMVPIPPSQQGDCGVMLLELCLEGSLLDILRKVTILSLHQLQLLTSQIGSALLYLREQGIVHRDVKPANILFCGGVAKLSDFGVSILAEDKNATVGAGTLTFMSYEAHVGGVTYATDVYAFGITLYLCYLGVYPFNVPDPKNLDRSFAMRKLTFNQGVRLGNDRYGELESMLGSMLLNDQYKRLSINNVMKHPFLKLASQTHKVDEKLLSDFRKIKSDFGPATREQFFFYLANRNPNRDNMSINTFIALWDRL